MLLRRAGLLGLQRVEGILEHGLKDLASKRKFLELSGRTGGAILNRVSGGVHEDPLDVVGRNDSQRRNHIRLGLEWQICLQGFATSAGTSDLNCLESGRADISEEDTLALHRGDVLKVDGDIALVQSSLTDKGVVPEAIGAKVRFAGGAEGVLLWILGARCVVCLTGRATPNVGEEWEVSTKEFKEGNRQLERQLVPTGRALRGRTIDYLGHPLDGGVPVVGSLAEAVPLINRTLNLEERELIQDNLHTGVKALDVISPIGKGQSLCIIGPRHSGKREICLEVLAGQRFTADRGVTCVYAATRPESLPSIQAFLEASGATQHTAVVAAPVRASPFQRHATLLAALSVAEGVRDQGQHALVVVDDLSAMTQMWESIVRMVPSMAEAHGSSQAGLLMSAAEADRRRFFSFVLQRSARRADSLGGGSSTLLFVLPGEDRRRAPGTVSSSHKWDDMSPEVAAKLKAALAKAQEREAAEECTQGVLEWRIVEEFKSIADGHIQLVPRTDGSNASKGGRLAEGEAVAGVDWEMQVPRSFSRLGSRAANAKVHRVAGHVRLELLQAHDEGRFGLTDDGEAQARKDHAALVSAFLRQSPGSAIPVADLLICLAALEEGFLHNVAPGSVNAKLRDVCMELQGRSSELIQRIVECTEPSMFEELYGALCDELEQILGKPHKPPSERQYRFSE
ncbi:hypothetical protein CYMTET_49639 [Cymbomonas tetramitiformis]|uniref:ATPase F1/V1/A1 complex alpha/beta subunit nucleotide-binding domain-containing protein n=1 Tax=Cymbomonas tetramitiformis TaxID=36881 RepID=A0AAE0BR42_9CHLO|nr:hypothetical protein CYMTET_49639 [Cymbomonas tetramitiformis]